MQAPSFPVTKKDLPPAEPLPLARWIDRHRWKFAEEEWFGRAEQAMTSGNAAEARQVLTRGVLDRIEAARPIPRARVRQSQAVSGVPPTPPEVVPPPPPFDRLTVSPLPVEPTAPRPQPVSAGAVTPLETDEPELSRQELLAAFFDDLLGTSEGIIGLSIAILLGTLAAVTGHGDWIGLALLDIGLAAFILLYPLILFGAPLVVLGAVVQAAEGQPFLPTLINFLAVCALAMFAVCGPRLMGALVLRGLIVAATVIVAVPAAGLFGATFGISDIPLGELTPRAIGWALAGGALTWGGVVVFARTSDKPMEAFFDLPSPDGSLWRRVKRAAQTRRAVNRRVAG